MKVQCFKIKFNKNKWSLLRLQCSWALVCYKHFVSHTIDHKDSLQVYASKCEFNLKNTRISTFFFIRFLRPAVSIPQSESIRSTKACDAVMPSVMPSNKGWHKKLLHLQLTAIILRQPAPRRLSGATRGRAGGGGAWAPLAGGAWAPQQTSLAHTNRTNPMSFFHRGLGSVMKLAISGFHIPHPY